MFNPHPCVASCLSFMYIVSVATVLRYGLLAGLSEFVFGIASSHLIKLNFFVQDASTRLHLVDHIDIDHLCMQMHRQAGKSLTR